MEVSVCVVTYNQQDYIAKALNSILSQKINFSYEIVIGNDFSSDNTLKICKEFQKNNSTIIRIISNEKNVGYSYNFCDTLLNCKGKYIAVLDGDDYWTDSNKLQKQYDFLESNPKYSMCFTDRNVVDQDGNLVRKNSLPDKMKNILSASDIIGKFTPPTQTTMLRSGLLTDRVLKYCKDVFNGDVLIFSYLSQFGNTGFINESTAAYRYSGKGIYSSLDSISRLRRMTNTYDNLKKVLKKENLKYLNKSYAVIYQRLFVLYFEEGSIFKSLGTFIKLIKNDFLNFDISSLKALRLLFKMFFNKNLVITD